MSVIDFTKYTHMTFTIEKMEDLKFDGNHPNGFNPGFIVKSAIVNVEESKRLGALYVDDGPDRWFHTSEVLEQESCVGYDLLHTRNSIYKITPNWVAIPGVQKKYSVGIKK